MSQRIPRPFACYDGSQLEAIRARIGQTPVMKEEFERQKRLSDEYARQEADIPVKLRNAYRMEPLVFRTPEAAAYVVMSLHIAGAGEARIARVQLSRSERGLPVALRYGELAANASSWRLETGGDGTAEVSGGDMAVRNRSPRGLVSLTYPEAVPVRPQEHYSMQTTLRLDEPLTGGVFARVEFLDRQGLPLEKEGIVSGGFNRATPTNWAAILEIAGADANLYMVTGEPAYAERAKRKLHYMLPDMCQGMDVFKATGWHDDDIYGAVHIGRGLAVLSVIYDQIADSGVIHPEEDSEIREHFRYIAGLMMDTGYYRFDLEDFPDEKGGKRSNWNADRATGLGIYALVFPEEELSEYYLEQARSVVDWQLERVVDEDGAWPENIRYHGAVLHRYFLFFALLERLKGIDYWSHPKVKGMYRFLIGTVTPKDTVQGGADRESFMLSPAVGDSNVHDQWFRLFAYAAPFYAESDPGLSGQMMWTWKHGGGVVRDTGAFPCTMLSLVYPRPELPVEEPELGSVHYPHIGYVIFRQNAGQWGRENYAIFEASPLTYHAHHDEGHFSIWANSTPITLDPGTGGYYNGDRKWYIYSHAHNVVQFADQEGRLQEGPLKSVCEETLFSPGMDYVRSEIPDALAESYKRHFAYVKAAGMDTYVVWDHIKSQAPSVWNLHTLSTSHIVEGNRITAECLNGMSLEIMLLEPGCMTVTSETGAVAGDYPLPVQEHFRISGEPGAGYLALLFPKASGTPGLSIVELDMDEADGGVRAYRVSRGDDGWFILLVNATDAGSTVALPYEGTLTELLSEAIVSPDGNGLTRLEVGAGRMAVLVGQPE